MLGNLFSQNKTDVVSSPSDTTNQPQPSQPSSLAQPPAVAINTNAIPKEDMIIFSHLDQRSLQVLSAARNEAARVKQQYIQPEQLLFGLLQDADISQLVGEFGQKPEAIKNEITSLATMGTATTEPVLGGDTKHVLEQAYVMAKDRHMDFIMPEDIFLSLLSTTLAVTATLQTKGIQKEKVEEKLTKSMKYNFGKKSLLLEFGSDLTELAEQGKLDPVAARDREIDRVIHILLRRIKNNPIIIGEAGVGKTAIVEGLAEMIASGKVPADLQSKRIIQLDVASLVAGAAHRGEFEERLRSIIKEVQLANGKIILFIDEIHTLIGAGQTEGALDASNIIKPFLARGQLQLIGSTTTIEYRRYFEKDKAFERRFQEVLVEEPTEEQAIQMMEILKAKYEAFHHVTISTDAIAQSVKLSKRYIGEKYLPDKAVDVIDEAAADVRLAYAAHTRQTNAITKEDIESVISKWTGIPLTKLTENESEKLLKLEDLIHKRLINQELAVNTIAEAVRRGRIGLASTNRPIASFIFLGPTGVGKTELAKTLAEILFGKEEAMIRIDMSEYMEKHEVAKLIGAPPGYVGYEEGGQLTEAVRTKPYSVVLFDEVEKAHPDVFNILLQLLEDGRLTDNKGNTISFKNTIVIATSNIGSVLIQQQLQQKEHVTPETIKQLKTIVENELKKFFRPELLNRFDEVIIFEPLGQDHMQEIAQLQLKSTQKLLAEKNITLTISQDALAQLAKEGFDPVYGARPLRRLIQSAIENPIARLLIEKKFTEGNTIQVGYDLQQAKYTFSLAPQQQPAVTGSSQAVPPIEPTPPVQGNNFSLDPVQAQQSPVPQIPQQSQTTPDLTVEQPVQPVPSMPQSSEPTAVVPTGSEDPAVASA